MNAPKILLYPVMPFITLAVLFWFADKALTYRILMTKFLINISISSMIWLSFYSTTNYNKSMITSFLMIERKELFNILFCYFLFLLISFRRPCAIPNSFLTWPLLEFKLKLLFLRMFLSTDFLFYRFYLIILGIS